jgi:polyhydroxyalkanoate synthase
MTEAAEELLNFWQHHWGASSPDAQDLITKHPDVLRSWLLLHMSQGSITQDPSDHFRKGPTPLPLHAHHFTNILSSIRPLLLELYNGNVPANFNATQEWENLHCLTQTIGPEELYSQIQEIIRQKSQAFIRGLLQYHAFPYHRRESLDNQIIWICGSSKLHDYGALDLHAPRILLIPSMINKPYILDLDEDQSLIQFLKSKGHHVFMLDWGAPQEERTFSLEDYFCKRLLPALMRVSQGGEHTINILGYCMGGVFAVALGQFYPLNKTVLIAPPWDFHAVLEPRHTFHKRLHELLFPFLEAYNGLPGQVIQALFSTLNPEGMFEKFEQFIAIDDLKKKRFFVALEDWANDNVDLAKTAARQILQGWFHDNTPALATFDLGLGAINPAQNQTPTLIITGARDRVVPHTMTQPLAHSLPQHISRHFETGHTGLVVGELAKNTIWPSIDKWLKNKVISI